MPLKKNILLFILAYFQIPLICYSQFCNPVGLFVGGISGESKTFGYYYFQNDSSFIFFTTKNSKYVQIELKENDTILSLGKGRWYIDGKYLITKFEGFSEPILQRKIIEYNAKTVQPYDSFFLKVNTNQVGTKSILFIFGNKPNKLVENSDDRGRFDLKYPIEYLNDSLQLNVAVDMPNFICLQQNSNYHEIDLSGQDFEYSTLNVINNIKIPYKIEINYGGKKHHLFKDRRFVKVPQGSVTLVRFFSYNMQIDSLNAHVYKSVKNKILGL